MKLLVVLFLISGGWNGVGATMHWDNFFGSAHGTGHGSREVEAHGNGHGSPEVNSHGGGHGVRM